MIESEPRQSDDRGRTSVPDFVHPWARRRRQEARRRAFPRAAVSATGRLPNSPNVGDYRNLIFVLDGNVGDYSRPKKVHVPHDCVRVFVLACVL